MRALWHLTGVRAWGALQSRPAVVVKAIRPKLAAPAAPKRLACVFALQRTAIDLELIAQRHTGCSCAWLLKNTDSAPRVATPGSPASQPRAHNSGEVRSHRPRRSLGGRRLAAEPRPRACAGPYLGHSAG